MISVAEAFQKFKSKLELTKTESQDAQKRHTDVRSCLKEAFDVERDILTGSYSRHTKTKPLKDIDAFFILGEDEQWRRDQPPIDVLDAFERCLRDEYDDVEPNRRCITVEFAKAYQTEEEGGQILSVDAVPAFVTSRGYEIPDRVLGQWVETDPEVHADQATKKNKALDGDWKPLVKMIKKWNQTAGKPIKPSFLIEVMAQDLIDPPFSTYPDEIINFFSAAQESIYEEWPDPAGLGPPVSDQMTAEKKSQACEALRDAERIAVRAQRAEETGKVSDALSLWRQLFGNYFPLR
ncbi:MAG: nucleotidyltransferase [Pseudomonadales bacterium]|nr:nucleotidyltransferase [Pseudomonadales bacterium]